MNFTWRDGPRTILFGRGAVAEVPLLAGVGGYVLLTTERAAATAPAVVAGASAVHHIPAGPTDQLAASLLGVVDHDVLVALGGGRVIDTAKALAGARRGKRDSRLLAIPTTLSGAEMTAGHRPPAGAQAWARQVAASVIVNDADLSASQPAGALAGSSANALAHAVEATVTTLASPVPTLSAREAQRLIDAAWFLDGEDPRPAAREQLALAALLAGVAVAAASFGLSQVMSQTLVRVGGTGHGQANAAVLPVAIGALERRNPGRVDPDGTLTALARRLARRAGAAGIRQLQVQERLLDECASAAATRAELDLTPPRASLQELRELYAQAW